MSEPLADFVRRKAHLPNGVTIERTQWFVDEDGRGEWRQAFYEGEQPDHDEVKWIISWGPKMGHFKTAATLEELIAQLASVA